MRSAWSKAVVRLVLPLLSCSAAACSSDRSHLDKQLSKLQDEVRHLQSETDRMGERLDAVETRRTAAAPYADERFANNTTTIMRPKLKVVHVEPSEDTPPPDGDAQADVPAPAPVEPDNGPRVVIEGEGKSIESRTLPGSAPVAAKTSPATKPAKSKSDAKSNKAEAPSSQ